ncbi:SDR family NAD(P)-dependent oxidoreductase, partial [Bacillus sp. SIMBA_161]
IITGRDMEKLNESLTKLSGLRGQAEAFQMDVREPEHAKAMVNFAHEKFGRIDGLVNNAAGNFIVHAEKLSPNGWRSVIDI